MGHRCSQCIVLHNRESSGAGLSGIAFHRKDRAGFTLIEALVAVGILVTAFGGMLALARNVIGSSSIVRQDLVATALAQEGVEIIRAMRDANWLAGNMDDGFGRGSWREGLENCSETCAYGVDRTTPEKKTLAGEKANRNQLLYLQQSQQGNNYPDTYAYDRGGGAVVTPFRREVELLTTDLARPDRQMRVRVTVRWCRSATASCPNESKITVEDILQNWFPR